jgi:hypothetical protein
VISATPAESPTEIMRMKTTELRNAAGAAENGPISLSFHPLRSARRKGEDCYTFEYFAPAAAVLRSDYYYHYKRNRVVLKEETKWS